MSAGLGVVGTPYYVGEGNARVKGHCSYVCGVDNHLQANDLLKFRCSIEDLFWEIHGVVISHVS
jgi:hypothetical protein